MTQSAISLVVPAGLDIDGAERTIEAAAKVRDHRADWEFVVVGAATESVHSSWIHWVETSATARSQLLRMGTTRAQGTWVGVLDPGDQLEAGAMEALHARLDADATLDVLFTDEQWASPDSGGIFTKPGWVPEYERGLDYLGRLCLMRASLIAAVGPYAPESAGAEEWDAHLRVVEHTDRIAHLPIIGVTRHGPPSSDDDAWEAGRRAVERHFARSGQTVHTERAAYPGGVITWRAIPEPPLVSVIVPTGGGHRVIRGQDVLLAEMCARSLAERTDYDRWELILVPSDDTSGGVIETVRAIVGDRLVLAPAPGPFNFSRSVNTGVAAASGELVLLLNDDIEAIDSDWLDRMVSVVQDPSIGMVGARLIHEDGLIQHVGVVYSDTWVPAHIFHYTADGHTHFGVGLLDTDFTAATGACLLMSRALYASLGGLTEDLPLNFNDVDLCHKAVMAGLRVVVTPSARLHHYESSTREAGLLPEEVEYLQRHWQWLAWSDPWVNTRSVR